MASRRPIVAAILLATVVLSSARFARATVKVECADDASPRVRYGVMKLRDALSAEFIREDGKIIVTSLGRETPREGFKIESTPQGSI